MPDRRDPINPTDDDARALARRLLSDARFGALAIRDADTGGPFVSRVAVTPSDGTAFLLVSELAHHARGLAADPACALLLGEPGDKGDPLIHPRMTLTARANPADKPDFRDTWLAHHPKAALYYDFTDFRLYRLDLSAIHLNGGFGKAYRLSAGDLLTP